MFQKWKHFYQVKITKHLSERNFLLLAIIWTVLITVASLVSSSAIPKVNLLWNDKIVHFLFYLVFVVLWSFANVKSYLKMKYDLLIVVFAIHLLRLCQLKFLCRQI